MDARLERKLRLLAGVVAAGAISGVAFNLAQGLILPSAIIVGIAYGLVMSLALGSIELFVLEGPMRVAQRSFFRSQSDDSERDLRCDYRCHPAIPIG
jgi:hypothetical protein